jgi:hypothetical protein
VRIDSDAHTLTVARSTDTKPLVFVWKDSTRFTQSGNKICLGALEPGLPVKVHYRREVGQLVPRAVSVSKGSGDALCDPRVLRDAEVNGL